MSPLQWLRGAAFGAALRLRLNGKPMPAPRPRMSRQGHAYNPKTYSDWTRDALSQIGTHEPMSGPVTVAIDVVGLRPKTTALPGPRGDCDNYTKAVLDVLTKARVWLDDSQVTALLVRKRWSDITSPPGVDIWITPATA